MRVILTESAIEMSERAGALLRSRVEHNVLATVLEAQLAPAGSRPGTYAYVSADDEVIAGALRVPPHPLLVTVMSDEVAEALMEAWLPVDVDCPGVVGVPEVVRAIVAAWQRRTGGSATPTMVQALHALDRVIPPERPASGVLRPGAPSERELLRDWAAAFARESGVVVDPEAMVDRRLERGFLQVWDDGGPVSMVGRTPAIAGAVRIAPVYTPPALRGRGYASSAVAAISQAQLDAGAERCILFTDLANPTSNRIYAAVGYRRIAAWEHIGFQP